MAHTIRNTVMGTILSLAALAFVPGQAEAAYDTSYCREYTRTVTIGNRLQDAYGTACQQRNGDWIIVGEGLDVLNNGANVSYVVNDGGRYIEPQRVVYYTPAQVNVYRYRPVTPTFVWYGGSKRYNYNYGWNRGYYNDRNDYNHWDRRHDDRRWDHDNSDHRR